MVRRILEKQVMERLFRGRVVTILGAPRVGKTTLVKALLERFPEKRTRYLKRW